MYVNKHLKRALMKYDLYKPEILDEIIKRGSLQHIESLPRDIKSVFVTSMDISPVAHIRVQAECQKYCENAISKTINFPNSATIDDIVDAYLLAWKLGCKGLTVYRDGSRVFQVLNTNEAKSSEEDACEAAVNGGSCVKCVDGK
jgi:ribonucleoside-diphosphate reductase alpha chain